MTEQIYQIFDKTFKKILTLSATAVINLINGLFGTDYPKDSTISYHWTEFEDDQLRRILADTILTINELDSYHIEAQMEKDGDIVFRVFAYGFYGNHFGGAESEKACDFNPVSAAETPQTSGKRPLPGKPKSVEKPHTK